MVDFPAIVMLVFMGGIFSGWKLKMNHILEEEKSIFDATYPCDHFFGEVCKAFYTEVKRGLFRGEPI